MIVICHSDRLIDVSKVLEGDLFVFGRAQALRDAKFIVITDSTGKAVGLHRADIQWPENMNGSTFPIRASRCRFLPDNIVHASCRVFDRKRFGAFAVREDDFEEYLRLYPVTLLNQGGEHGNIPCK